MLGVADGVCEAVVHGAQPSGVGIPDPGDLRYPAVSRTRKGLRVEGVEGAVHVGVWWAGWARCCSRHLPRCLPCAPHPPTRTWMGAGRRATAPSRLLAVCPVSSTRTSTLSSRISCASSAGAGRAEEGAWRVRSVRDPGPGTARQHGRASAPLCMGCSTPTPPRPPPVLACLWQARDVAPRAPRRQHLAPNLVRLAVGLRTWQSGCGGMGAAGGRWKGGRCRPYAAEPRCMPIAHPSALAEPPPHQPTLGTQEYTMWRTRCGRWCASGASAK